MRRSLSHSARRRSLLELRAHGLRQHLTETEQLLWQLIRGGKLGAAFRRQAVVGEYIVDFVAPQSRLIVEVDGGYHRRRAAADARRDRKLARLGYRVLRLQAELVQQQPGEAVALVRAALALEA